MPPPPPEPDAPPPPEPDAPPRSGQGNPTFRGSAIPPEPLRRALLVRVVSVWAFVRLAGAALGSSAEVPFRVGLRPHPGTFFWVLAVVIAALAIETRRRKEDVLLADLGYSFGGVAGWAAGVCVVLEVALGAVLG